MRIRLTIAWLSIVLLGGATSARAQYQLERAFPNLTFTYAVDMQSTIVGVTTTNLFVVEKRGVITVFPELIGSTPGERTVFLDITSKVQNSGEAGLVGLAFHPNFYLNGYFFVFYVSKSPYRNIVARYKTTANPLVADPASELILLDEPKVNLFHNGGQLAFGPNSLLYVTMGDDQITANGQDLNDLNGAMLRIAPNIAGSSPAYTIPNGNPYKGNGNGYREEIFAYGFRNPWRFSIDPATSDIWLGDVGENDYEEIDIIKSGGNYGWPLMEGPMCYQPSSCDTTGKHLRPPIDSYDHAFGSAVIGGHVFHGTRLPELEGKYIFADFDGTIWSLTDNGVDPPTRDVLVDSNLGLLAFGVGNPPKRDLYVSSSDGYIYRLSHIVTAAGDAPRSGNRLLGNFPNPFNPSTMIRYQIAASARVAIEIVSVDGARIRMLDHGSRAKGAHEIAWRGETDAGGRAASGVYFYRLFVDGIATDSARMVLVQ